MHRTPQTRKASPRIDMAASALLSLRWMSWFDSPVRAAFSRIPPIVDRIDILLRVNAEESQAWGY
jgi:hypothetical protein